MDELAKLHCSSIGANTARLGDHDVNQLKAKLPGWIIYEKGTEWGKVTVTWWTHKIKCLHQNDFIMAAKTEQIYGGRYGSQT